MNDVNVKRHRSKLKYEGMKFLTIDSILERYFSSIKKIFYRLLIINVLCKNLRNIKIFFSFFKIKIIVFLQA